MTANGILDRGRLKIQSLMVGIFIGLYIQAMEPREKINYLEFPASDLASSKVFFETVFGWKFVDFGTDYSAFSVAETRINGGFYRSTLVCSTEHGSALAVFYSQTLELTQAKIESAGGRIVKPVFSFPGGRRFHFTDPSHNEFSVWSDS